MDICAYCSEWIHHHPSQSYAAGYLVEHWRDPAEVPVKVSPRLLNYLGVDEDVE